MTDVLTYKVRVTIEKEITVHLPAHTVLVGPGWC